MKFRFCYLLLFLMIPTLFSCANLNSEGTRDNNIDTQQNIISENRVENETLHSENVSNRSNNDQEYMKEQLQNSYFKEVEIEITYANELQFEAEINEDDGVISAMIEDELKKNRLTGIDAFEIILSKINPLNIQPDSDHQGIIDQVIAKFRLPIDYKKFELEIEFHDGKELKIEQNL